MRDKKKKIQIRLENLNPCRFEKHKFDQVEKL